MLGFFVCLKIPQKNSVINSNFLIFIVVYSQQLLYDRFINRKGGKTMKSDLTEKTFSNLITTKELAKHLGVTEMTILRWRKKGMPFKKIGPYMVRFDLDEVMDWTLNKDNQ